jgi:hypothetical protein
MATATVVKAPQTAAFTDGSFDVASGDTVFLTTDEATGIPVNEFVTFYYDNAALDRVAFTLNGGRDIQVVGGNAKLIAKKGVTTAKIGVGKFSA